MRRGYTAQRYLRRLSDAREGIEDLAVTTDLIVGFPGKPTPSSKRPSRSAPRRSSIPPTLVFSPRPGTRAASMGDDFVEAEVIRERFERLKAVLDRSALRKHAAREGRREEVLVEGPSRRNAAMLSDARVRAS